MVVRDGGEPGHSCVERFAPKPAEIHPDDRNFGPVRPDFDMRRTDDAHHPPADRPAHDRRPDPLARLQSASLLVDFHANGADEMDDFEARRFGEFGRYLCRRLRVDFGDGVDRRPDQ